MDRTHFLSNQAFQRQDTDKPGQAEIDAFYDEHGWEFFAALPRWRETLKSVWLRLCGRPDQTAGFEPETQRR